MERKAKHTPQSSDQKKKKKKRNEILERNGFFTPVFLEIV